MTLQGNLNAMETAVLTLRLTKEMKSRLDQLAQITRRSKSFLAAEAIERYLDTEAWQILEIEQALRDADAGDFASEEEVRRVLKKHEN